MVPLDTTNNASNERGRIRQMAYIHVYTCIYIYIYTNYIHTHTQALSVDDMQKLVAISGSSLKMFKLAS